jgi:transposase
MKAIPVAVRERIIHLYGLGKGTDEIAASFGYCASAVRRVRQRLKERGTLEPQTHLCGRKPLLTDARKARLLRLLEQRPDATLAELAAAFKRPTSTMDLWLTRLGWSCKKKRCTPASSRGPTWRSKGGSGPSGWRACPPTGWCSWMKAGSIRG